MAAWPLASSIEPALHAIDPAEQAFELLEQRRQLGAIERFKRRNDRLAELDDLFDPSTKKFLMLSSEQPLHEPLEHRRSSEPICSLIPLRTVATRLRLSLNSSARRAVSPTYIAELAQLIARRPGGAPGAQEVDHLGPATAHRCRGQRQGFLLGTGTRDRVRRPRNRGGGRIWPLTSRMLIPSSISVFARPVLVVSMAALPMARPNFSRPPCKSPLDTPARSAA